MIYISFCFCSVLGKIEWGECSKHRTFKVLQSGFPFTGGNKAPFPPVTMVVRLLIPGYCGNGEMGMRVKKVKTPWGLSFLLKFSKFHWINVFQGHAKTQLISRVIKIALIYLPVFSLLLWRNRFVEILIPLSFYYMPRPFKFFLSGIFSLLNILPDELCVGFFFF